MGVTADDREAREHRRELHQSIIVGDGFDGSQRGLRFIRRYRKSADERHPLVSSAVGHRWLRGGILAARRPL